MTKKNVVQNKTLLGSITVLQMLGVLFVALKLTNNISWSWWWVTVPFWGPAAFIIFIVLLVFLGVGLIYMVDLIFSKKDNS